MVRPRNTHIEEGEGFRAQLIQQQARGDVGVVGFFLDQRARRHDQGGGDIALRDAVVHVAPGILHDARGDNIAQPRAGFVDERPHTVGVQRMPRAIFADHLYLGHRFGCPRLGRLLLAQPRVLFAIQHVAARNLVLAAAHERKFDLILYVLDVDGSARREPSSEYAGDDSGEVRYAFADSRRCRRGAAFGGEKSLRYRDCNLVVGVRHHSAVALDDPELARRRGGDGWSDGPCRRIDAPVELVRQG